MGIKFTLSEKDLKRLNDEKFTRSGLLSEGNIVSLLGGEVVLTFDKDYKGFDVILMNEAYGVEFEKTEALYTALIENLMVLAKEKNKEYLKFLKEKEEYEEKVRKLLKEDDLIERLKENKPLKKEDKKDTNEKPKTKGYFYIKDGDKVIEKEFKEIDELDDSLRKLFNNILYSNGIRRRFRNFGDLYDWF